jgi:hypothetical protein
MRGEVPVDVFREYVERALEDGVTAAELALRVGIVKSRGHVGRGYGDGSALKRYVGLLPSRDGRGHVTIRATLTYPVALRLCEGLGIDPVDAGL